MDTVNVVQCTAVIGALVTRAERIDSWARVHKTLFLLQQMGLPELNRVQFRYRYHSPFSFAVADALLHAVSEQLVQEDRKSPTDSQNRLFCYSPGTQSQTVQSLLTEESQEHISTFLKCVDLSNEHVLNLAATIVFLRSKRGLGREEAEERALQLKSEDAPYLTEARNTLKALRLA